MQPNPRGPAATALAMALLIALLAGCGSSGNDSDRPAGQPAPLVTPDSAAAEPAPEGGDGLHTIATTPGWESALEPILTNLEATGDSGITFALDVDWMDANAAEDVELRILDAVAAGELDAGYVGVRSLAAAGVTGFDPLVAPGLIDSYQLQEAVLNSDIPGRLLPALGEIGVAGVAVVAGPMRYPIGTEGPFTAPEDYSGATFHTFAASINTATAEALEATHSQLWGDERDAAIDAGAIDVTENTLRWMRDNGRGAQVNLEPLWPATGVLVVRPEVLAALSPPQADALTSAIEAGQASSADLAAADATLATELCERGVQLVLSSPEDVAAMRGALQPVYNAVGRDATAASTLAEIERIKAGLSPAAPVVPQGCTPRGDGAVTSGAGDGAAIEGSYQLEWTAEELMSELDADAALARGNDGVFVLSFADGEFDMVWRDAPDDHCGGAYRLSGSRVQLVASEDLAAWTCGGESLGAVIVDAAWTLEGGQLTLSDFVRSPTPDISWWMAGFLAKPLTPVP